MSKINVPNAIRYLYPATVESVGLGTITAGGRVLRTIGNVQVRPGDRIWTDGRVAYGHTPPREQVNPPAAFSGVPFIGLPWGADNPFQGYYTDTATRKPKRIGNVQADSFLVNNGRRLYLERVKPGRALVDAEILANEKGESIGYSIATANEGEEICSANNSEIIIENSLGTWSETIALKNDAFAELVAKDFAEVAGAKDYKYTSYNTQYLNFRFTDELGNWELIAGVNVYNLSLMRGEVPENVGHPLFTVRETLSRKILSREPFIGNTDVVLCEETITVTSEQSGEYVPSSSYPEGKYWQTVERAFAAVRLNSKGELEVIHKNYYIDEGRYYWVAGWDPETSTYEWSDTDWPYSLNALPEGVVSESKDTFVKETGSYSYYIRYGVLHSDEDIIGAPVLGMGWGGFSGTTTSIAYQRAITEHVDLPSIWQANDLAINLPDGFTAKLAGPRTRTSETYGVLDIMMGEDVIATDYQKFRTVRYDPRYGLVYGGAVTYRWAFPHVSCYKFLQSPKVMIAEYGDRLLICQDGQYEYLDRHMANTRLRRMRRIVRIPASKLEPGQNIN